MKSSTKSGKKNGYVLVDALVTVMIATLCMTGVMGGLGTVARLMTDSRTRIQTMMIEYNELEKELRITDLKL